MKKQLRTCVDLCGLAFVDFLVEKHFRNTLGTLLFTLNQSLYGEL